MFLSAALLFVVQPMVARMVLPRLGGSPSVWNTALVFYQAMLLGGYLYVHFTVSRLGVRRQTLIHLGLIALVLVALPIAVPRDWTPPAGANPIPALLALMFLNVGLPFFAVSTTGPLLQRWFSTTGHRAARDPYFLYAASNLGSLLGLLSYPVLIEPRLRLADQSRLWQLGYLGLALLVTACAVVLRRARAPVESPAFASLGAAARQANGTAPAPIHRWRALRWVLLAFVPSSLMMSVTTLMSAEIAAIPLLWVVPLAIYLASFIIVFARRPLLPHPVMLRVFPFTVVIVALVLMARPLHPLPLVMSLHFLVMFAATMVCHGELAKDRPDPEHLTGFYLWIAVGGVAGGVFNALIAPLLFTSVAEYPITLTLACLLAPPAIARAAGPRARFLDVVAPLALGAVLATVVLLLRHRGFIWDVKTTVLVGSVLIFALFAFRHRPLRFGLGFAAMVLASPIALQDRDFVLHAERSFFGIHRVTIDAEHRFHRLFHGTTLHGLEAIQPEQCREPLGYYSRLGPMAQVFASRRPGSSGLRVAVAGLGAGGLAAYAEPADDWTFYEIDPAVERIASDPDYFCFLASCPAPHRVALGDARLSMAAARDRYDVIVLDAYSSDAIPVHLLTREALHVYLDHLAPGGVLAFHISNRYFALAPVVASLAADAGLTCRMREHATVTEAEFQRGIIPSHYAVLARDPADLGALATDSSWTSASVTAGSRVWTDDYSSLWSALRR